MLAGGVASVMVILKERYLFCDVDQRGWRPRKGQRVRGRMIEGKDRRQQSEPLEHKPQSIMILADEQLQAKFSYTLGQKRPSLTSKLSHFKSELLNIAVRFSK